MTTEAEIQAAILLDIGSDPDIRLFRNNVGTAYQGEVVKNPPPQFPRHKFIILRNYRVITYGLAGGSHDLIGWRSIIVTLEMVGQRLAVFLGIEVKRPGKDAEDHQSKFHAAVTRHGGISGVARAVSDARKLVSRRVIV